ncbi:gamma-glutamyltransferase [Pseudogemmatithrix spongiicola]|uniref:Glutathione hydrolase proenzyme n=1 Tax=Pseudogemmatithrix spongiicola TaxID=3062599 RepID=A0AA49JT50_9BACT|nr:gamma-glutamyltransferase [Gemmatimonadaceae bacterium 'strain 138']WKW14431.1 gamma-glutamyltransferase [Gemmatimonadaceae bacterium 'strain 318']
MRRTLWSLTLLAVALTACRQPSAGTDARLSGTYAGGWRFPELREPVTGANAMVSSNSDLASAAGAEIMRAGGNAVDAAVAVGFALAVTYPFAGNIGGGGFMTIRMADGRTAALDYREVAPLAATRDMYVDSTGKLTDRRLTGHLASGVPGAVAGMAAALERYGTKSLAEVMAPAIRLARDGFPVDSALFLSLRGAQRRLCEFAGCATFYPNGAPPAPGSTLRQPELARSLQLIAEQGPKAFYDGPVGEALVEEMRQGGGIITREDLRRYEPKWREPILTTYRGHTLITMPPASSGGITMSETFNILERFAPLPPFGSPEYVHLLAEAFRRSFMDRNAKLADPDFVPVPREQLVSKEYAAGLASQISRRRASRTPAFESGPEPEHTTHYSVVDARGNAVATTTTINGGYGSAVWVRGGGFFLNNEMDDFAAQPGTPNMFGLVQGEANAIQPGKRMLSAMSPTIVLDPQGDVLLVVGAAGGPTIITATTQVILNVIEFGMPLTEAMRAPRMHHQALPDAIRHESQGFDDRTLRRLRRMGHELTAQGGIANVNAVMRSGSVWHGVHEPRGSGGAVGY